MDICDSSWKFLVLLYRLRAMLCSIHRGLVSDLIVLLYSHRIRMRHFNRFYCKLSHKVYSNYMWLSFLFGSKVAKHQNSKRLCPFVHANLKFLFLNLFSWYFYYFILPFWNCKITETTQTFHFPSLTLARKRRYKGITWVDSATKKRRKNSS